MATHIATAKNIMRSFPLSLSDGLFLFTFIFAVGLSVFSAAVADTS